MTTKDGSTWLKKVIGAAVGLLVVAAGARMAYELLVPLVPSLIVLLMLVVVLSATFGLFHRG
jgi:hypothetical protein